MTSSVRDLRVLVDNLDEYIRVPGGIDRLKRMILNLAISGQLVPQDRSEGTGEKLYSQIQAEKNGHAKQNKIKKQKTLSAIDDDEIPFNVPGTWRWMRLGDFSIFIDYRGKTPSKQKQGTRLITAKNVKLGYVNLEPEEFIRNSDYETWMTRGYPSKGDVLFTTEAPLANVAIYDFDEPVALAQRIITIHPYLVSGEYLKYAILSPSQREHIFTKATGTTVSGIKASKLKEVIFPLPPLAEQKRITKKVESLFSLIDDLSEKYAEEEARRQKLLGSLLGTFSDKNNSKALELFLELVRSKDDIWWLRNFILHQAVSGRLTRSDSSAENAQKLYERALLERTKMPSAGRKPLPDIIKHEVDYELPETWRWVRLGEVTNYGKTEKRKPVNITKDTWLLELEDIEKNSSRLISKVTAKERNPSSDKNIFRKGDVLYGKLRPYLDKVIVANSDGVCSSEILPIRAYGDSIHPEYLLLVMKSPNFVATVNEMTYGVKMPRLGTEDGRKMPIPLAPYAEQLEIVERTKRLLSLVAKLEAVFDSPYAPIERVLVKDNKWWFALKQGIGSVLDKLSKTQYERGEMVIAKYMYLLQEVYKVPFGLQFVKHQFGPYDPDIKKAILGSSFNKDKFFTVKGSGVKQVYSLGMKSDTLMKYSSDILTSAQSSLDELMQYTANAKSRDIERLATVCKIIQDSQSNDEQVVINEMKAWKNDKFPPEEVKKTLAFIRQQDWDDKLMNGAKV